MSPDRTLILGIESSCDETAAAVVSSAGDVLSNAISSQIPIHARFGGVIPELASRNHLMAIGPVVRKALDDAGIKLADISRIGVTRGPGLMGALMMGLQFAKGLAVRHDIELVPVHHVEGHITAILLADGGDHPHGDLTFPYAALAVSGGHTSIYRVDRPGSYHLLGITLDDAAGEAFDKVARVLGLPYPGGVEIDRIARNGNPKAIQFPRPLKGKHNIDFSFSGLKTAVKLHVDKLVAADMPIPHEDIAASFQQAVVDVLLRKLFVAADHSKITDVVISGGVAANSHLRAELLLRAPEAGLRAHLTKPILCTDNAAMIANAARYGTALSQLDVQQVEPFASGQLTGKIG